MKNKFLILFLLSLVFVACDDTPDDPGVVLPSNLVSTTTVTEGRVDVTATAENANFFTFTFFEGTDSTSVEAANGVADYTFTTSGTHTVRTRAHASYTDFIETSEDVTIDLGPGFTGGIPTTGYTTPLNQPGYTLVWNDEFAGSSLSSDWTQEIGTGNNGWGNNELQFYRAENTQVTDGMLIITAKQELYNGSNYTSSRIKTQGMRSFKNGRIDIRAAVPFGQGIWPALWMLGDEFSNVGWPACGEIDIMEMVGGDGAGGDNTVHGTIHWDNNGSHAEFGGSTTLSSGIYAENFHVYSIIWTETEIRWLVDDQQFHVADISPAALSELNDEFFFIFNIAVGGNWPGNPD